MSTTTNFWGRGDGDVYRYVNGVEGGAAGWFGEQPVVVVGDFLRLLGFWLLGFFGGVSANVTAYTLSVEYGAFLVAVSAMIKTLFAFGVNKFFERKVGMCIRGLGREWGCGVERPGWLNALAVLGSDVALRGFLAMLVKSCIELHLKDVLKRRGTRVFAYAISLHVMSFLIGLIPGGGILSAIGAVASVVMYSVHWEKSPGAVYLWIPLACVVCGVGDNFTCVLFPVVCVLAEAVPEVKPLVPRQRLTKLAAAIVGDVYIPDLDVEDVNRITSVYDEMSETRERLMKLAFVGDRFLKLRLAFECAISGMSRGDASHVEQTRQSDMAMRRFLRYVYPTYEEEFPVRLHGKPAASMVEAVVGLVTYATLFDPEVARRFYIHFDNRVKAAMGTKAEGDACVSTPSSSVGSVVDI